MKSQASASLLPALAILLPAQLAFAADALWLGADGGWSNPVQWSSNPDVPDNNGTTYDVTIGPSAGPVTLDLDVTIDSLAIEAADLNVATGESFNLTILGPFVWDGGTHGGGGITVVNGTATLRSADNILDGRTLVLNGNSSLTRDCTLLDGAAINSSGQMLLSSQADVFGYGGSMINAGHIFTASGSLNVFESDWQQTPEGILDVRGSFRLFNDGLHSGQINIGTTATFPQTASLQLRSSAASGPVIHTFDSSSIIRGTGTGRKIEIQGSSGNPVTAEFNGAMDVEAGTFFVGGGTASVRFTPNTRLGDILDVRTDGVVNFTLDLEEPSAEPISFTYHLPAVEFFSIGELNIAVPDGFPPPPAGQTHRVVVDSMKVGTGVSGALATTKISQYASTTPLIEAAFSGPLEIDGVLEISAVDGVTDNGLQFAAPVTALSVQQGEFDELSLESIAMEICALALGGGAGIRGDEISSVAFHDANIDVGPRSPANPGFATSIDVPSHFTDATIRVAPEGRLEVSNARTLTRVHLNIGADGYAHFTLNSASDIVLVLEDNSVFECAANLLGIGIRGRGVADLLVALGVIAGEIDIVSVSASPGSSSGTLTFSGEYNLSTNAAQTIEIGGLIPDTEHDQLIFNDSLTLSGTLDLHFINGFHASIQPGDTFTIITCSNIIEGAFTNAANGERLDTTDGKGSFVVNYGVESAYDSREVVLSEFQPAPGGTLLSAPGPQLDGSFQFTLLGIPGSNYVIEATEDFQQWQPIATNPVPPSGELRIEDPQASAFSNRFYRAFRP